MISPIVSEEKKILFDYFPELTKEQNDKINALFELYSFWNDKINVISRKDIEHLYLHHVLHSMSIAKFIHFTPSSKILDVGTGGGFPGIPLAILMPNCTFYLNDSIQKKITVVSEVAKALTLKNVIPIHERAEKIKDKFDFIISRAVTNFPDFMKLVQGKISSKHNNKLPNGIIYLKGGSTEEIKIDMQDYFNNAVIFDIYQYFSLPFFETKKIIYYS